MTIRQHQAFLAWLDGPDLRRPSRTDWYLMRVAFAASGSWLKKPAKELLSPIEFKEAEPPGKTWRNWHAPKDVWKRWQTSYAKMAVMARAGLVGKAMRESMVFTGPKDRTALVGKPVAEASAPTTTSAGSSTGPSVGAAARK
jgi:hypothetical protein